jgi:protein-S-isoprenylcysteine O-methyltransferase Ste14
MSALHSTFVVSGNWLMSWIAAAAWADRAFRRPARRAEWLYRLLTFAGGYLVFRSAFPLAPVSYRLWALGPSIDWVLFVVALAGFAFAWRARPYLGRLWSSSVTLKVEHRIVDAGPYAAVRHPIYTGSLITIGATLLRRVRCGRQSECSPMNAIVVACRC